MVNPQDLLSFAKRAYEQHSQPLKRRGLPGTEDMTNQGLLGAFSLPALANAVAPVGEYEDGSMGLAFPQILAGPAEAWQRMYDTAASSPVMDDDTIGQMSRDSFDAAGLAMTGGLGVGLAGGLADDALKATVDLPASAAFKFGDEIFDAGHGRYHANAIRDAVAAKGKDAINSTWDQNSGFGDMEGFVSLGGNFQTRKQAADAIRSSGKAGDEFIGDELHASTLNDFRSRGLWANAPTGSSVPLAVNALERAASDLPMDLASRMARAKEMGFDTEQTFYHGTVAGNDISEFGLKDARGGAKPTYFVGEGNRDFANGFSTGDQGRIYPVKLKTGEYLDTRNPEHKAAFDQLMADVGLVQGLDPIYSPNAAGESVLPGWGIPKIMNAVRDAGWPGMVIQERPSFESMAVFDPTSIRSVNAAFDPALSDSANLLAANAPTGAAVPAGMEASQGDENPALIEYLRSVGLL